MCYINWRPDEYDPPTSPGVRPVPQLKWATPVDIVELGASLEAFLAQESQITTLRLCHRFGDGSLSQLPQEILDRIIADVRHAQEDLVRPEWDRKLRCFQGRCTRQQHLRFADPDYEDLWEMIFVDGCYGRYEGPPLNRVDFTEDQMKDMVDEELIEDGYHSWDEDVLESHWDEQYLWLDMVCICKKSTNAQLKRPTFIQLLEVSS